MPLLQPNLKNVELHYYRILRHLLHEQVALMEHGFVMEEGQCDSKSQWQAMCTRATEWG